ncbi:unnamed protein product [Closterium sp. Yama58-4]|nr:unnamed protein product [Closterium sp. Yama58-4]
MTSVFCDWVGHVVAIEVSSSYIVGSIPAAITNLENLEWLSITDSVLNGSLPADLFTMPSLTDLILSGNQLTGSIPDSVGNAVGLETLNLARNNLSGSIPAFLRNNLRLKALVLEYNQFTGSIPDSLGDLTNLQALAMIGNVFTGQIPPALGNCTSLTFLNLGQNNLSGTIPSSLGNLQRLQLLSLPENKLSGSLPEDLSRLQQLSHLDVFKNALNGELPAWVDNMKSLTLLSLTYNMFSGSLPDTLGNLKSLSHLWLDFNRFSGTIPESIGDLTGLSTLTLGFNTLLGTIPASLVNLQQLIIMSMPYNLLVGTIPAAFSTLTRLEQLDLESNQLVGQLPSMKLMPRLEIVDASNNFLTGAAGPPPPCPPYQLLLQANCFAHNLTICGQQQTQDLSDCYYFCENVDPLDPPCSGHGVCYILPFSTPKCSCDYGYTRGAANYTCVPEGPYIPSLLTSYKNPMTVFQSASSTPNGSIFLSSAPSTASWGAAFTQQPIALFLPTTRALPCNQPISFSVYFAFRMTPTVEDAGSYSSSSSTGGEGLAFVVSATAPQGAGAAGVGLGGVGRRSVAVEFDSVLSVKHSDPNDNHVGVNVGGSPVSLASATAPLILNDAHTKHAWIHYDPTSGGTLRVFLSASRQQPSKAVLTARVSLCSALKPTAANASFLFGFVAGASASNTQRHDILSWKIVTGITPSAIKHLLESTDAKPALFVSSIHHCAPPGSKFGLVASAEEVAVGSEGESVPSSFHYASLAFLPDADGLPSWNVPLFVSWMRDESSWPVKNQHGCADSSAYAVVAAVEAAYSIAANWSQPPTLSVEQLRLDLSSNCADMPPRDVLAFLVAATRKGGGLVDDQRQQQQQEQQRKRVNIAWPSTSPSSALHAFQKPKLYGIQGFEESSFGGWLGLLLAVQRQPVVVRMEASATSFLEYDGTYKYADSGCFQEGVNHAVLLVGYAVKGSASSPFSLPAPLWVIRNSWGSGWGDAGHMVMDMQSGAGVCGINTLPGIFPILRSAADPCGSKSVLLEGSLGVAGSNAFNPCGQFKCSKAGASNRCACAAPHFVQTSHPDGSNTCAYVDACGLAGSNPCVVGTCVNDGKGSYSCVCPPGFVQGTTAKGTLSCAPGDSKGSYTVRGSNVWCSDLIPALGLTLDQLKQQNKKLSCSKPIPLGSKLSAKLPQSRSTCSLFYTTQPGDSCASIALLFGLSEGCLVEGEPCGEALVGLNPGLDCAALKGRHAVCVEREESNAGVVAVCEEQYELQGSGGCDAAMTAVDPSLSPLEFYRLNPGINCDNRLPIASVEGYSQRKVCIGSSIWHKTGICPGGTYSVAAGDSCAMIDVKGFASIKGCYRKINGFECLEKMPPGTIVCTPDTSNARVGNCSM